MIKFDGVAKVAIVNKDGVANPCVGTDHDSESNYLIFKLWQKNGYKRIYASDYRRRRVGYIDCNAGNQIVSEFSYGDNIETMKWFRANYEF